MPRSRNRRQYDDRSRKRCYKGHTCQCVCRRKPVPGSKALDLGRNLQVLESSAVRSAGGGQPLAGQTL